MAAGLRSFKAACPVCGEIAAHTASANLMRVVCLNCGRFQLSDAALQALVRLPAHERELMLTKARQEAQGGESYPSLRAFRGAAARATLPT
ncbi:hypothetical protein M8997_016615 [Phyllobacterium sp. 21LDTY02-6]|uniref:hypothetical protein n=1 Tax=unclassified Phyllobacterium TaxID=2638441 RepID=UPI00201FF1EF|nr:MULTISPECIES: hypothetical protein [unclassified Phyllobacterium]MCO4318817.1 hypothetical protein [Phyllobacterium sp. 21LDTY02-6]MCX8281913.1 hypothetical protein [Phyllobacterium sp. 0TCS1.6C]MCX8295448.1 hypothetical protein [Phyllobacterium sp. 0TCS1.6A]